MTTRTPKELADQVLELARAWAKVDPWSPGEVEKVNLARAYLALHAQSAQDYRAGAEAERKLQLWMLNKIADEVGNQSKRAFNPAKYEALREFETAMKTAPLPTTPAAAKEKELKR